MGNAAKPQAMRGALWWIGSELVFGRFVVEELGDVMGGADLSRFDGQGLDHAIEFGGEGGVAPPAGDSVAFDADVSGGGEGAVTAHQDAQGGVLARGEGCSQMFLWVRFRNVDSRGTIWEIAWY